MNDENEKVQVGVVLTRKELEEMKAVSCVDSNSTAVLAMARKGLESERKRF